MKNKQSIHEKAIRLVEGGIVVVDGLSVRLGKGHVSESSCFTCEIDSLCHIGTEMFYVCEECDRITRKDCYLSLVNSD